MKRRINQLPHEIIIEILSRLPVKSLIRFRSVSKSWNSLIIDPSFIHKHLNQAQKCLSHKRSILCKSSLSKLSSYALSSSLDPNIRETETVHIHSETIDLPGMLIGACNGLFCIRVGSETLLLWNPSTKKFRILPFPDPKPINFGNDFPSVSAFGYDSNNDDYKVMRIVCFEGLRFETLLYSLKKDSWSIIPDYSPYRIDFLKKLNLPSIVQEETLYRIDYQTPVIFVNEAFHWLVIHGKLSESRYTIVSFDLMSEKYGTVPLPDESATSYKENCMKFNLAVLREWLCLYFNYFGKHFVVWAMMDYGVEKSWTQILKFEYDKVFGWIFGSSYIHVVPKSMRLHVTRAYPRAIQKLSCTSSNDKRWVAKRQNTRLPPPCIQSFWQLSQPGRNSTSTSQNKYINLLHLHYILSKYVFDDGEVLLKAEGLPCNGVEVFRYKKNEPLERVYGGISDIGDVHVYVETLVSPLVNNSALIQ